MIKLLALLTKRQPPASRLRMTACFDEFRKHGIQVTGLPIPSGVFGRFKVMREAARHDVVLIQKKTSFHTFELKALRWLSRRLLFDMDDAVMFHEAEHRQPLDGKNLLKFLRTVNHCTGVVAGNRFLAGFAEANCKKVTVLPTPVDLNHCQLKDYAATKEAVVVGWLGVSGNLHYLRKLAPVFRQLKQEFPQFTLKVVSNNFIDIHGVPITKELWSLEGEAASLASFDIGLMPLDDTVWARGKCGYKILQYFGAGVPAIASPVGINTEFIQHGENGFLASNEHEWLCSLRELLSNPQARKQMGLAGRRLLEDRFSMSRYVSNYAAFVHECANQSS